jgi:hypothetical protein
MRLWKRNRAAESDAEFDARMLKSHASFIEHYNATFDFEAGLDEVYTRAGLARPVGLRRTASAPAVSEVGSDNRLLQQICDHIDMIDNLLASVADGDTGPIVTITYLTTSRHFLLQLRNLSSQMRHQAACVVCGDGVAWMVAGGWLIHAWAGIWRGRGRRWNRSGRAR